MKRNDFLKKCASAPHLVWMTLFIIAPLCFVIYYSFTDADGAFTLSNIASVFTPSYLRVFARSIAFAFLSTLICLLIGYPVAYYISRASEKMQKLLIILVMLPMWTNFLIRTYSLMVIFEDNGLINSALRTIGLPTFTILGTNAAVIIGMVYNFLPFMILPIYSVLTKMDNRLIEAAHDLGCTRFGVLCKVTVPLSISGIVSGITMVFVPAISTFYISKKMVGEKFDLIGDVIEKKFTSEMYDYNLGSALALGLMILILISMLILNKYSDDEGSVAP
ncbi:MAG: ABC transporter permease [Clostridia bacterium]|nr:ABC transporter permease [Clostridia bacterium]